MTATLLQILIPVFLPYFAAWFITLCSTVPMALSFPKFQDKLIGVSYVFMLTNVFATMIAAGVLFADPDNRWDQVWEVLK